MLHVIIIITKSQTLSKRTVPDKNNLCCTCVGTVYLMMFQNISGELHVHTGTRFPIPRDQPHMRTCLNWRVIF